MRDLDDHPSIPGWFDSVTYCDTCNCCLTWVKSMQKECFSVLLTAVWTLLASPVKVGVSVSVLYGGSRTLPEEASGIPGGSLELGMELNKCFSPSSQMRPSNFLSRSETPGDHDSTHTVTHSSVLYNQFVQSLSWFRLTFLSVVSK